MQLSTRSFSLKSLVVGVIAVGLVSIAIVVYSQWLVTRDFQRNTLFMRLVQSVQQEVATAHLWFEEALGGDRYISIDDDVRAQILAAQILVDAAIYGGATPLGEIPVLHEARDSLILLREHIAEFDRILSERWDARATTGIIGGELDQQFDAVFGEILELSTHVSEQIDQIIAADQQRIFVLNVLIIVILVTSFSLIATLVIRNRQELEQRRGDAPQLVAGRSRHIGPAA